jgi:hypothetical protein
MAMRTNSVPAILESNKNYFETHNIKTAKAIFDYVAINWYALGLSAQPTSLGQIPNKLKEWGWTNSTNIKELYGSQVKTSDSAKVVHFNGYSNNLSTEFRRAYGSYAETDSSAPKLADIFSQVTQDAKDFIASIAENPLFKAFLNASNCREPSKDFALIGIKTAAMIAAEKEAAEKLASDLARKIEELEKNGFLVFNANVDTQSFKLADEAIAARHQIDVDHKAYLANIAEMGKIKKGIEGLEKNLANASTEVAKETLTAKIADERIELGKLESKIATQGQALIGLANRSKRYADLALIRHAQLVKVITGLIESSESSAKLAETAGIEALASVEALIKDIEKTAPEVIDPRASKLAEKRGISIQEAMQIIKDME